MMIAMMNDTLLLLSNPLFADQPCVASGSDQSPLKAENEFSWPETCVTGHVFDQRLRHPSGQGTTHTK
jgi:hypothetical protein